MLPSLTALLPPVTTPKKIFTGAQGTWVLFSVKKQKHESGVNLRRTRKTGCFAASKGKRTSAYQRHTQSRKRFSSRFFRSVGRQPLPLQLHGSLSGRLWLRRHRPQTSRLHCRLALRPDAAVISGEQRTLSDMHHSQAHRFVATDARQNTGKHRPCDHLHRSQLRLLPDGILDKSRCTFIKQPRPSTELAAI